MSDNQFNIGFIKETTVPVEELHYEPIDSRYRSVQIVLTGLGYLFLNGIFLLLLLLDNPLWCVLSESAILIALILNLIIVRKAWLFKGYALREHDVSFRSGIIFPSITTIPFQRVQQVSMKQNPVSKFFNLYAVEVVNGAQTMAALTIPGLTQENANKIKDTIINKLKNDQD